MGETVTSILGKSTENGLQMGDKCPSIPPGAAEKLRTPAYGGEENAMIYTVSYPSPLGELLLAEREGHLAGLWMEGQKYFLGTLKGEPQERTETPVLRQAKQWLDRYFAGERPEIRELPLDPAGSAFRRAVWEILCDIPYGGTRTYGDIARELAARRGTGGGAAQAVGGAVGCNPVSIVIPCHRVVGSGGSLTGYAGGLEKKRWLLAHEGVDLERFFVPKQGTALQRRAKPAALVKKEK